MRKNTPGVECDSCKKWQESKAASEENWMHVEVRVYGRVGKRPQVLDFCSQRCYAKWGRDVFFAEVVEKIGEESTPKPRKLKKKQQKEEVEGQTTVDEQIEETANAS